MQVAAPRSSTPRQYRLRDEEEIEARFRARRRGPVVKLFQALGLSRPLLRGFLGVSSLLTRIALALWD